MFSGCPDFDESDELDELDEFVEELDERNSTLLLAGVPGLLVADSDESDELSDKLSDELEQVEHLLLLFSPDFSDCPLV